MNGGLESCQMEEKDTFHVIMSKRSVIGEQLVHGFYRIERIIL
jgi:hypothetical protein